LATPGNDGFAGYDGDVVVILLTGGTKRRQQRDIDASHRYWQNYKQAKRARG
jgi:putative component of toxin-antitoxin plasmid stabilization module